MWTNAIKTMTRIFDFNEPEFRTVRTTLRDRMGEEVEDRLADTGLPLVRDFDNLTSASPPCRRSGPTLPAERTPIFITVKSKNRGVHNGEIVG